MNKVLVTGLALGKGMGFCDACDFDFDWIVEYPSVLIWADKLLVSPTIWETVSSGESLPDYPELAKSLQIIFKIARAEGIIEVIDPATIISPDVRDAMLTQIDKDRALLVKVFPDHVRLGDDEEVPGQIFIDGYEYCSLRLWTIYAGLLLARAWDAQCLFGGSVFNYCRYKFGLSGFPKEGEPGSIESFHSVFEAYVPNTSILPKYVLGSKGPCDTCAKEEACKDKYLLELEKNLKMIIRWRDYDEIQQIKAVVEDIVRTRHKSGGVIDPADILHDFRSVEDKLRRRVKLMFPKVRRWANITTMLSIPVAVAGHASGAPLITGTGAGLAGLSILAKELVELLSSKYSWIGFVSKETELHQEAQ